MDLPTRGKCGHSSKAEKQALSDGKTASECLEQIQPYGVGLLQTVDSQFSSSSCFWKVRPQVPTEKCRVQVWAAPKRMDVLELGSGRANYPSEHFTGECCSA